MRCDLCQTEKQGRKGRSESEMLPRGWKRLVEQTVCDGCLKERYALRAVAMPVLGVIDGEEEQFREAMLDAFRLSTDCWNWATRQLLQVDVIRTPGMTALPAMPKVNLYRLYNDAGCPLGDLATQSRTALFQMAQSHYVRHRHQAIWLGQEGLPLKRFPAPLPVHNQSWKAEIHEQRPALSFRLHGQESGPRWQVRLASGAPFRRQLAQFRQLVSNEAIQGQLDLHTQGCGQTDRNGIYLTWKRTSGGQRIPERLIAKMVGWFPRKARGPASNTMHLATHPECFWLAEIDGRIERPWILNGDYLLRSLVMIRDWQRQHADWLQRIGEDRKHEKRWPIAQRRQFQDRYELRCQKHRRRVKTWIDQMVAQVIGFAQRRQVGVIAYDDADRGFAESFPWHQLKATLQQRCNASQIILTEASRERVDGESPLMAALQAQLTEE